MTQPWCRSWRADPSARDLADRHYSRQSPGAAQFVQAGSCLVLLTECGRAYWVTSWPKAQFVKHAWASAWQCSAFRSEGAGVASELIRAAIAATRAYYGAPPALGLVTMIDEACVKPTRVHGRDVYGWTWLKAGFELVGRTQERGLLVFRLAPERMPEPLAARPRSTFGLPLFDEAS